MSDRAALRALAAVLGIPLDDLQNVSTHLTRHYRKQSIVVGTKTRDLLIPSYELKRIQRGILRRVLRRCDVHAASHCRPGCSILTNARMHVGNSYVSTMDLKDAFPSITPKIVLASVRRALRAKRIHEALAVPIAALCTFHKQLPQGAPTSTALLDFALYPIDVLLAKAAETHGLTYTRYVDDLSVSGGRPLAFFRRIVGEAVGRHGLHLNAAKTRTWGPGRRATVTGLILDRGGPASLYSETASGAGTHLCRNIDLRRCQPRGATS